MPERSMAPAKSGKADEPLKTETSRPPFHHESMTLVAPPGIMEL